MPKLPKGLLFLLLASSFVAGCGTSVQSGGNTNVASAIVASPDVASLQVSNDPKNLQLNDVNYVPVIKGKQKKALYFRAPSDGKLSFSNVFSVIGSNCDGQKKDPNQLITVTMADFKLSFSAYLKDKKTGGFSIQPQADNFEGQFSSMIDSIPMKAGDEIQFGFELDSPANCDNASTWFQAAFTVEQQ